MRLVWGSGFLFALVGLCFSAPLLKLQLVNPTYAILTLEHYRAYYSFYMLGPRLDSFARLGAVAGALLVSYFVLWAARRIGLTRYLRLSARGERFSWPWRSLAVMAVLCLGFILQVGWLAAATSDLLVESVSAVHRLVLLCLGLLPALLLRKASGPEEHRLLRWPLSALVLSGALLGYHGAELAYQFLEQPFLVPPVVSTHYGPWGMVAWITLLGFFLGLAVGIMLLGITPRPETEPDDIHPIPSGNLGAAVTLSLLVTLLLSASYPLYLVPRYHLGRDLVELLDLQKQDLPPRSVVWLDNHDPPHTLAAVESWSTPENLSRVEKWMVTAPIPSATTRPAAKMLGDHALYQWRPEDALDWLEVHRRRLRFSNLNRAFLEVIGRTGPSPRTSTHLEALTDPARFAWPGPGSRLELAAQMRRYGWEQRASEWENSAFSLGGERWRPAQTSLPVGSLQGRLLLEGQPLTGARVALFKGEEPAELLQRTRRHVIGEEELVTAPNWRPTYYQYVDFERLANFYSVAVTDAEGYFGFEPLDPGLYRLAVRLDRPGRVENPVGLVRVSEHHQLGEIRIRSRQAVPR